MTDYTPDWEAFDEALTDLRVGPVLRGQIAEAAREHLFGVGSGFDDRGNDNPTIHDQLVSPAELEQRRREAGR